VGCATGTYIAGTNEMAIIDMGLQAFATTPNNIQLAPLINQNNGPTMFVATFTANQSVGPNSYGSTHTVASIPLNAGVGYRFFTGARVTTVPIPGSVSEVVCRTVVTIAKRP
jgi:hypothetical protein